MNKKILLWMLVLITLLISITSVIAAEELEQRSPINPSLDMLDDVAGFEITIPHPADYGRETVNIWVAVGVGIALYFLFFGLTGKYLKRVVGEQESVQKGLAIGLTLTSIFAAPVIEMIAGLIAFFFGMTTIVGLLAIAVVVVLMLFALKGFWTKQRGVIMEMEAEGLQSMTTARKAANAALKDLEDSRIIDENPTGTLAEAKDAVSQIRTHDAKTLYEYTRKIVEIIRNIPKLSARLLSVNAIRDIYRSPEGRALLDEAEAKLMDLERHFNDNYKDIEEIKSMNDLVAALQKKKQEEDLDPTQIIDLANLITELRNKGTALIKSFATKLNVAKKTVRNLNGSVIGARNLKIDWYFQHNLEPYVRDAERKESEAATAIAKVKPGISKIDRQNTNKRDELKKIRRDFLNQTRDNNNITAGSAKKFAANWDIKASTKKPYLNCKPAGATQMRFGEFSLTLRVRLNSLQSIQRKLVTHKVGSASSDDQIESVLSWVAPNNKNEELNIR